MDLAELLEVGPLRGVPEVARSVLGSPVSPETARRWSLNGRGGVRLPVVRGLRRRHLTTEAALRRWLAVTSGGASAPIEDQPAPKTPAVDVAVIESFRRTRATGRKGVKR